MTPEASAPRIGAGMLLATACGTAIASVSALGLFQIERLVGGLWSVAAITVAGVLCAGVARALARLCVVVPSGAGLLAYLSRGLGRRAGMALALPYLLLTLFLVGVEALVVGTMLARVLPVPPVVGALGLVLVTWGVCRAGIQIGYRAQAISTALLVGGMVALTLVVLFRDASLSGLGTVAVARLLPPAPEPLRFAAAVGQALFLFMGFELVTTQVSVARSPAAVGRALRGSVGALAAFYGLVSLGFSALPSAERGDPLVPQLEMARAAGGGPAVVVVVVLCLLASFTSLNGALLALSRFIYALASQGILPRGLAALEGRGLVPSRALALLAAIALASTLVVASSGLVFPIIFAAAMAAALAYAAAVLVRERAPFAEADRSLGPRVAGAALAAVLGTIGVAVVGDAGPARGATLAVAGAAVVVSLLAGARAGRARVPTVGRPAAAVREVRRAS